MAGESSIADFEMMGRALDLAREAAALGEVPVGAAIAIETPHGLEWIAESGNRKETNQDPLGHAEIRAIRAAAEKLGRWRLSDCVLYVTLEPCTMCAGAIVQARLKRVVYGAVDSKAGAVQSVYQVLSDPRLNHAPLVTAMVREEECRAVLQEFFATLRKKSGPVVSSP